MDRAQPYSPRGWSGVAEGGTTANQLRDQTLSVSSRTMEIEGQLGRLLYIENLLESLVLRVGGGERQVPQESAPTPLGLQSSESLVFRLGYAGNVLDIRLGRITELLNDLDNRL